jgi:hypothetical protein
MARPQSYLVVLLKQAVGGGPGVPAGTLFACTPRVPPPDYMVFLPSRWPYRSR